MADSDLPPPNSTDNSARGDIAGQIIQSGQINGDLTVIQMGQSGILGAGTGPAGEWIAAVEKDHDRLFGADANIKLVSDLLSVGPNGTITSLHGDGGLGKTTVAYEATLAASGYCYTRIAWASARQIVEDESSPNVTRLRRGPVDVLRDLTRQLGLEVPAAADIREVFPRDVRALADRGPILLVIDNVESADDLRDVVGLLTAKRVVDVAHVLVTTRRRVDRSWVPNRYPVYEHTLTGLDVADGCAFIRYVGRAVSAIGAADDERLAAIHRLVDGNPYLIKITTRQLCHRAQPLDVLLRRIKTLDEHKTRAKGDLATEIRDYMFSAALDQLDIEIGPDSRSALLAAFCAEPPGSRIGRDELIVLSDLSETEFDTALEAAESLSLVTKHGLGDWFSIHSLLHAYSSAPR